MSTKIAKAFRFHSFLEMVAVIKPLQTQTIRKIKFSSIESDKSYLGAATGTKTSA